MARTRIIKDGKKRTLYLGDSTWKAASRKAKRMGISISQLVRQMIDAK